LSTNTAGGGGGAAVKERDCEYEKDEIFEDKDDTSLFACLDIFLFLSFFLSLISLSLLRKRSRRSA
jgi:hypothetical protein